MEVSVIIPIHNGAKWIDQCFRAILNQTAIGIVNYEICICNDASTDQTNDLLKKWEEEFNTLGITIKVTENKSSFANGVGFAKNQAVSISTGTYLCFQDVDDVMLPDRILKQFEAAKNFSNNTFLQLLGCKFKRKPENSTERYTKWANNLNNNQLNTQIYTSNGPTVIMPTWFCHRKVYDTVRGFDESGRGTPEDLIFFYKHLDNGGEIRRVDDYLLIYNYHVEAATFSILADTLWQIRLERLETKVLNMWEKFTIWNAGKQGRKLYKSLSEKNRNNVMAFCDIDEKKINKKYTSYDPLTRTSGRPVDIIHFTQAIPPIVICVKLDMTQGAFENNLKSIELIENKDYVYFS